jgi:hypothetical protein
MFPHPSQDKNKSYMYVNLVDFMYLKVFIYVGKSVSKLQMDIELKQIRVLIWKYFYFST